MKNVRSPQPLLGLCAQQGNVQWVVVFFLESESFHICILKREYNSPVYRFLTLQKRARELFKDAETEVPFADF